MGKWRPPGEAFEGRAIEPGTVIQPVYRPGQYADLRDRLVRALGQPTQAAAGSARLLGTQVASVCALYETEYAQADGINASLPLDAQATWWPTEWGPAAWRIFAMSPCT